MLSQYSVSVMTGEKTIEVREMEKKRPGAGQVLVRVDSCAICTLEQRVYSGRMRYYPFAGGHEVAGIVEETGEGVRSVREGDKVAVRLLTACGECHYCRIGAENQCVLSFRASVQEGLNGPGGLAEYMLVDSKTCYKVADDLDLAHAALTEPLACCVHSVDRGNIQLGDDVAVIGAGIMGVFHVQLAKLRGARVIACEISEERLRLAKAAGADVLIDATREDPVERVKALTDGRGADVVFCTAALADIADQAIRMTGKLGRCVLFSSFHPKAPIELDINNAHYSEMIITGSVNPQTKDFLTAAKLLSSRLIDPSRVVSETVSFAELDRAFARAVDPASFRVIVKMRPAEK